MRINSMADVVVVARFSFFRRTNTFENCFLIKFYPPRNAVLYRPSTGPAPPPPPSPFQRTRKSDNDPLPLARVPLRPTISSSSSHV